jgi:geranylgeranyl pyrophosphate synthase
LPVFFAVCNGRAEDTLKVQKVLHERDFHSVDRADILKLVEQSGGLNRTRVLAQGYATRALELLEEFPGSLYRDAIMSIPEFILNRSA